MKFMTFFFQNKPKLEKNYFISSIKNLNSRNLDDKKAKYIFEYMDVNM